MSTGSSKSGRRTILVVEDEPVTRTLVEAALAQAYTVHVAADAFEATAILERIGVPDLIVCDVLMPKMDGLTFIKGLRQRPGFDRVPVMFLTSKSSAIDVVQGINAGARHYVTKPFQIQDLIAKISKILV